MRTLLRIVDVVMRALRTIALTPDSRTAFVTLQGRNRVAVVDLTTFTVTGYADTGTWPDGIGYTANQAQP